MDGELSGTNVSKVATSLVLPMDLVKRLLIFLVFFTSILLVVLLSTFYIDLVWVKLWIIVN